MGFNEEEQKLNLMELNPNIIERQGHRFYKNTKTGKEYPIPSSANNEELSKYNSLMKRDTKLLENY